MPSGFSNMTDFIFADKTVGNRQSDFFLTDLKNFFLPETSSDTGSHNHTMELPSPVYLNRFSSPCIDHMLEDKAAQNKGSAVTRHSSKNNCISYLLVFDLKAHLPLQCSPPRSDSAHHKT